MTLVKGKNLTLREAAERLGVTTRTVQRWICAGVLRVVSVKWRTRYIHAEDVDYLARGGSPDELIRQHLRAG